MIEDTEGVDYVKSLSLQGSVQSYTLKLQKSFIPALVFPRLSSVQAQTSSGVINFPLVNTLAENATVESLNIKGFREGDTITLYNNMSRINLLIKNISENVLKCEPNLEMEDLEIPGAGSVVETIDSSIQSYLLTEVDVNEGLYILKIAVIKDRDSVTLIHREDSLKEITGLSVKTVSVDAIFLADNDLVYTGTHLINKEESSSPPDETIPANHPGPYYYGDNWWGYYRYYGGFDFTGIGDHLLDPGTETINDFAKYPPLYPYWYYWYYCYYYSGSIQFDFTGIARPFIGCRNGDNK